MLILSRRVNEALMIGDDVKLTILSIKGNQVRIGCDAPSDVKVHREEIYQRIQTEGAKPPKDYPDKPRGELGMISGKRS